MLGLRNPNCSRRSVLLVWPRNQPKGTPIQKRLLPFSQTESSSRITPSHSHQKRLVSSKHQSYLPTGQLNAFSLLTGRRAHSIANCHQKQRSTQSCKLIFFRLGKQIRICSFPGLFAQNFPSLALDMPNERNYGLRKMEKNCGTVLKCGFSYPINGFSLSSIVCSGSKCLKRLLVK